MAQCAEPILAAGFKLQAAAALLHIIGGAAAYLGLKKFYSETTCRTVAIETSRWTWGKATPAELRSPALSMLHPSGKRTEWQRAAPKWNSVSLVLLKLDLRSTSHQNYTLFTPSNAV